MFLRAQHASSRLLVTLTLFVLLVVPTATNAANPVGTAFTYQGQLVANGQPYTGTCQVQLSLFDALSQGSQVGSTVTLNGVSVSNGLFSVTPDFGMSPFTGQALFLQTAVECGTDTSFTVLSPREALTATPYALQAASVSGIVGMSNGGTGLSAAGSAGNYLRSDGTAWTSSPLQASDLPAGSSSYIQNGSVPQTSASFNVDGNGTIGGTLAVSQTATLNGGVQFADGSLQTTAHTPQQIALLRWYPAIQTGATFAVGNHPEGMAFDGTDLWIANSADNSVTKLRASDGAVLGTFTALGGGTVPDAVAFDGANIWVTDGNSAEVTELRASDGALLANEPVGNGPQGIAFDGRNVWVANNSDGTVTRLLTVSPFTSTTFTVGGYPYAIAIDGANIWVASSAYNVVTELRASDGEVLNTVRIGSASEGIAFDGANLWVTDFASKQVTKVRASDGTILGTYNVGNNPDGVAFDGANIWVANQADNTVSELRASDGKSLGTYSVGSLPWAVAFDGANVWITNFLGNSVSKL